MNIVNENSFKFCIYNYNNYSTTTDECSPVKEKVLYKSSHDLSVALKYPTKS